MKTFLLIGWRNLWRHKRRSVVVMLSIAVGIFAMMISMGFMNGINRQMIENTISTSLGHIAIHQKGFQDNMKIKYNFYPEQRLLHIIKNNPDVQAAVPKVKIQGMIRSWESSQGVMIVGIDPEEEKKVSNIYNYMLQDDGSEYLQDQDEDVVLISRVLAEKLKVVVGDKIVIMLKRIDGEIVGEGLRVKGYYQSPVDSFDKYVLFTGLRNLQRITHLGDNISEITITTTDKDRVDAVKEKLEKTISDTNLEILSWRDMAPNLVKSVEMFDNMMYMFFGIIFVTVIFSVANTLVMAIMERFHEIGVMKSIGTHPLWIFAMILFEAINLGILGLVIGVVAYMGLHILLQFTGIDLSIYRESMRLWGSGSIIYPVIRTYDVVVAFVIVMLTNLIAALYPAVKAARIKPLDALHYT